ncbi:TPA: hypothetical protein N0F65_008453 [Lagenidium giganteum]|uniref:Amino acid transporter transmembrane domain-containing protein n=1 Tax=Lagenidium giganteum TaxID=4803 RepID=A0AAV2YUS2_9STRA|nr:TPA: hypothetical protein N0F65_008453 [Lagenidium giganteum]
MDWSAVYDNHGEEDGRWEEHGETRSSRNAHRLLHRKMSMSVELQAQETQKYTPLVAYAFTVNYILGVGSLGIPFAFYQAGIVLSNVMIVLVSVLSYMTVMWVSETVARAREVFIVRYINECTALNGSRRGSRSRRGSCSDAFEYDDFPEVTQLCERFLGPVGSKLYQISLLGLMYGGLLGYSQVFVNSFLAQVSHIGALEISSMHAALVFAVIVIPLSCSDLTEQIMVQLAMSVVRFVALLIMIFSAAYAIHADPYDSGAVQAAELQAEAAMATTMYISDFSLVNFSGFGIMFSTAVFSQVSDRTSGEVVELLTNTSRTLYQLFQHSVPGLLAPLGNNRQAQSHAIFGSTLLTTTLFYIALGTVCSLYFGPKVASSVNLNWADFTWGISESSALVPFWAKILSMIVVIFPALDTLSVYPLISITLGDNMAAVIPDSLSKRVGGRSFWKVLCRLTASIPPVVVSMFVADLSITLQFSGMFGVYVAFFAPALLQLSATKQVPDSNVYSGRFSGRSYAYGVLVFGVFALGILLYQFAQQILRV